MAESEPRELRREGATDLLDALRGAGDDPHPGTSLSYGSMKIEASGRAPQKATESHQDLSRNLDRKTL
jgi:hypothetical protein